MAYDQIKTIRVQSSEWNEASEICDQIHISLSSAINCFIKQIIVCQGLPIGVSLKAGKAEKIESLSSMAQISGSNDEFPLDDLMGDFGSSSVANNSSKTETIKEENNDFFFDTASLFSEEPAAISEESHNKYKNFNQKPNEDGYIVGSKEKADSFSHEELLSQL